MTATSARRTAIERRDTPLPLREPSDVMLLDRLLGTLADDVDLTTVTRLINRSRADLAGSPPGAMPELLERLVRQRLR